MNKPAEVPAKVKEGIERYAKRHEGVNAAELLGALSWDPLCGCYGFERGGMYHGVELDGHIHT